MDHGKSYQVGGAHLSNLYMRPPEDSCVCVKCVLLVYQCQIPLFLSGSIFDLKFGFKYDQILAWMSNLNPSQWYPFSVRNPGLV